MANDRRTAAETCGMDRLTLCDWVHRSKAEGLAGLANRRLPQRPRRLAPAQLAELAAWVEAGPDPVWCAGGAAIWLAPHRDGVRRRVAGVPRRPRNRRHRGSGGCRSRPQQPKSDPEAQAAFKKTSPRRQRRLVAARARGKPPEIRFQAFAMSRH